MSDTGPRPKPGEPAGAGQFLSTHWSLVIAAGDSEPGTAHAALSRLCETYWYPLYAYVRRRGFDVNDAQDLTQSFFAHLMEKDSLRHADSTRGKFRSFLLASISNFLTNEWRRETAQKRGGGRTLSLDFENAEFRLCREPADDMTPQRVFERRWALTVLESALGRLQEQYREKGKQTLFESLAPQLDGDKQPYAQLGATLGMSEGAVKVAAHRLRKAYRDCLREEIAQTVTDPSEVDAELEDLMEAVRT